MLNVQEYLKTKSLDDLANEHAIKLTFHDYLPLVILNYDQIESTKTNSIVRECRGLVLDTSDFSIVAKGINRFFNWGEVKDEMDMFNFNNFSTIEKVDGSLILFYNYKGKWHANTRGSFGLNPIDNSNITWQKLILLAARVSSLEELNLNPELTYVCELCSMYNKVVRKYSVPTIYFITAFNKEIEVKIDNHPFKDINKYNFSTVTEITDFLNKMSVDDPTFEGVVICDDKNQRWKIKNPTYISLHQMRGEGNIHSPKYILPFILSGETAELLCYFPEVEESLLAQKKIVDQAFHQLQLVWENTLGIESQKEFALKIIGKTRFTGILFDMRKKNKQTLDDLKKEWRNSKEVILKQLFPKER